MDPEYYTKLQPHEPIDVIHHWRLTYAAGSAVAYIARAGRKPGVSAEEDLLKAIRMLEFEIIRLRKTEPWGKENNSDG